MAGFDFSSFFGNSKSSGMGGFNFGDYALIRNGGYKKLMKSYYSPKKESATEKTNTKKDVYKDSVDTSGLSKVKKEAEGLKQAAEKVTSDDLWKQKDGAYDMDSITSAVKSFANEYNDVVEQAQKANNKDVSMQVGFMTNMSNTMSKSLSKVGVSVGADGKLSVDEDTLKKADIKDVKAMFSGKYSYAADIASKASGVSSAALRNASLYGSNGAYKSSLTGDFNQWI